jgi:hypothetical protein
MSGHKNDSDATDTSLALSDRSHGVDMSDNLPNRVFRLGSDLITAICDRL